MDIETSFGAWLRNRRRRLGLTQEELADQVGCSAATIRKIESDLRRPSRQIATLLAKILVIEASEQPLFVQVARQERLPERLAAIPSPVQPSPQFTPATVSAPIEPLPLPSPPTPLIGRETERAYLCHLLTLPECRLVTLVGPGGSGKTHLALAVAADLQGAFANGVAFVGLASLSTTTLIAPALGKALGLTFTVPSEPQTQLLNYLHRKEMLILVDNMEHLLDSGDLLAELLAQAPALKLLVTSRERLNLPGEWVFDLHGLPIPPPSHPLAGAEEFTAYSSVALFVLCARRVQANFALAKSNQVHVARICRLLDGLPLGIELAAAWVRMLSCEEIAAEIEQNIDFLTVARRNVPDRHRSLRAAFDHSWKLLTQAEQQALSQLALFRGGFVRAAAQAVAEAPLPVLSSLVTKSLVRRSDEGRYDLHEMTRQFAASHLHEDEPAAQAAQERHSRYFLAMVAQHDAALKGGAQGEALALLDREVDNIYQAWNWAVTNLQLDLVRQVADDLALFSLWRGRYQQGEAAFQLAVEHLGAGVLGAAHRLPVLVQLLTWQATFCRHLGKTVRASELLQEGLRQLESLAEQPRAFLQAPLLLELGRLASETDRSQAIQLVQQSLRLYEVLGDQHGMAGAYFELGEIARQLGNLDEARHMAATSLRLYETFQNTRGIADALLVLNYITLDQGELSEAERLMRQRIALYRQIGDRAGLANAYRILGHLLRYRGEYIESMRWFDESLAIFTDLGDRREMAIALAYQAIPRVALGHYAEARVYGEQALTLGHESNSPFALGIVQVLLGTVALATAHYAEAGRYLRTSVAIFNGLSEPNLASQALAWLGYAELGLGDPIRAQRALVEALQIASSLKIQMPIMIALPALVLLMATLGKAVRASELYALAMRYPIIATTQFVTDVVGVQMAQIAASLPLEIISAAEERGRSLDLAATVAGLIAEFGIDFDCPLADDKRLGNLTVG